MRLSWMSWVITGLSTWASASPAYAQSAFQWQGRLAIGQTIEIKGINGDIRATASASGEVEVTATRMARRSNPDDVRIEVMPHAGGVTICAIYPASPGRDPNRCESGDSGRQTTRDNDTVVHFEVRVPDGVGFVGRTVNGGINGESLRSDAEGHTVNGSVRLSTTGLAVASTTNGSVNVIMGRGDWSNEATFKTVNGSISLTLPGALNADIHAEMLNGTLTSDFPISITSSTQSPRRLRGTIGGGGRELNLSTVNGGIRLFRAP
jgi:hypothetical protein